ncbi:MULTISPECIES: phosphotransferase family protein [unclassified Microbacterium]|uniref:phosphotransferase family protein n=1 Tax=unclassified Microbacterium TaxID=2609290 RepID=UPI00214B5728|nr:MULTISPECIES: phosphotransferase family protein [unclassified Microbacterium]MCR2783167.1 phosphotransferase family protein [Microbacterium sp. zg.B96]WIM15953.1 phosphotransferase family protein [Microbacterium sp. zg-B96]
MTDVPGLDAQALTAWLAAAHPDLADPDSDLTATVIAGGRSNLTYAIEGARHPLVLRRPPLGHVLASAHDMRREHRVISALADTPVPVPVAIDIVDDTGGDITGTTFFLMERAPGRVLSTPAHNAPYSPAGLRELSVDLVRTLADLHAVDAASVGLPDFGRADGYLSRQLATWRRQLDASRSRPTPALDELQERLGEGMPQTRRSGIVHGDYRLDNALVDGPAPRLSAILDWEMATLGDPLVDLGIFALYWDIATFPDAFGGAIPSAVDPAAGYPGFDELAEEYARRAGVDLPALGWYRAFAAYKLAVILEGIHYRFRSGDTVGDGFDAMGALVEPLARQGLEAL